MHERPWRHSHGKQKHVQAWVAAEPDGRADVNYRTTRRRGAVAAEKGWGGGVLRLSGLSAGLFEQVLLAWF